MVAKGLIMLEGTLLCSGMPGTGSLSGGGGSGGSVLLRASAVEGAGVIVADGRGRLSGLPRMWRPDCDLCEGEHVCRHDLGHVRVGRADAGLRRHGGCGGGGTVRRAAVRRAAGTMRDRGEGRPVAKHGAAVSNRSLSLSRRCGVRATTVREWVSSDEAPTPSERAGANGCATHSLTLVARTSAYLNSESERLRP